MMKRKILHRTLIAIYFAVAFVLVVSEFLREQEMIMLIKPFLIPTLMVLYLCGTKRPNILYLIALLAAVSSNILFLFTSPQFLLIGIVSFIVFSVMIILIAAKTIDKIYLLPFVVATIPFLFIYSCLLYLTMGAMGQSLYPAITNGVLMSVLCGLALSNYIMIDDKISSYFVISAMLFGMVIFLFIIQKYYLPNVVFPPMSALIFSFAHFAFYKFLEESEKQS